MSVWAAGRRDDQVEAVGCSGAAEPKRALLRADGDAHRHRKGDHTDEEERCEAVAPQRGDHDRQRIHCAGLE